MKPELKSISRNLFYKEPKIEWGYVIAAAIAAYLFMHIVTYFLRMGGFV